MKLFKHNSTLTHAGPRTVYVDTSGKGTKFERAKVVGVRVDAGNTIVINGSTFRKLLVETASGEHYAVHEKDTYDVIG